MSQKMRASDVCNSVNIELFSQREGERERLMVHVEDEGEILGLIRKR